MFLFSVNDRKNIFSEQELNNTCEKYYLDIYKYCAARLDISYAGDITNDVFKLFCQKWHTLENKNYKSWLYETANNLIKNFYKKHKRKIIKETYIEESINETLSYEQNFEMLFENISEDKIEIYKNEILKVLSEEERQLFNMKYIEKSSIMEISIKLAISENNVKQRLFRLRTKIKNEVTNKLKQL